MIFSRIRQFHTDTLKTSVIGSRLLDDDDAYDEDDARSSFGLYNNNNQIKVFEIRWIWN